MDEENFIILAIAASIISMFMHCWLDYHLSAQDDSKFLTNFLACEWKIENISEKKGFRTIYIWTTNYNILDMEGIYNRHCYWKEAIETILIRLRKPDC